MRTRCRLVALLATWLLAGVALGAPSTTWQEIGPPGGRVTGIAINPSNTAIVYVSLEPGGVWRTLDGGATWADTSAGLPSLRVRSLVIDGNSPSILYALSNGVSRTTDGGQSWSPRNGGQSLGGDQLLISRQNPQVILLGGSGTVWRTTNAGQNWSQVGTPSSACGPIFLDFAIDPTIVWLGSVFCSLHKSDSGNPFALVTGSSGGAQAIAAHPTDPNVLYFADLNDGGVQRRNADGSFSDLSFGLADANVRVLAVDPKNASTLWAGTLRGQLYRTTNAAAWLATDFEGGRVTTIEIDPVDSRIVWVGTGAGVFKTTDQGATWTDLRVGLPNRVSIEALALDGGTPATLYAGGDGNGAFRTVDVGASWTSITTGLDGGARGFAADRAVPGTLLAATFSGIHRSTTGGDSWGRPNVTVARESFDAVTIDPTDSNRAYAARSNAVFGSVDGGRSWIENDSPGLGADAIAVDPANPSIVWAGGYKSIDRGLFFAYTNPPFGDDALVVAPGLGAVFLGGIGGVARTTDGGATWQDASEGLAQQQFGTPSIEALAFDPVRSRLYASSRDGVFESTNAGVTWTPLFDGLPDDPFERRVAALAVDTNLPITLYAGKDGGGVLKLVLTCANAGECNDGNACTSDDCAPGPSGGDGCAHGPIVCAPAPCRATVTCNPATGCDGPPLPDGTACDDGDPCTASDVCQAGTCVAAGFETLTCGLTAAACAGQPVPKAVKKALARARKVAEAVGKATKPSRAKRLAKKAVGALGRAERAIAKAAKRKRKPISAACADALRAAITSSRGRIGTP